MVCDWLLLTEHKNLAEVVVVAAAAVAAAVALQTEVCIDSVPEEQYRFLLGYNVLGKTFLQFHLLNCPQALHVFDHLFWIENINEHKI